MLLFIIVTTSITFRIGSLIRRKDPLQTILKSFGQKSSTTKNKLSNKKKQKSKDKVDIQYSKDDSRSIFMILGMQEEYPEKGQAGYDEISYYNNTVPKISNQNSNIYPYHSTLNKNNNKNIVSLHNQNDLQNEIDKSSVVKTKAKRFIIDVLVLYSATNQYFYNFTYSPSQTSVNPLAYPSNNNNSNKPLSSPSVLSGGISYSQRIYKNTIPSGTGNGSGGGSVDLSRLSIVHLHYDFMTMDQVLAEIYENLSDPE